MSQVVRVTRNKKTGKIEDIEFFKEFYDADLDEQQDHLRNLLFITENRPRIVGTPFKSPIALGSGKGMRVTGNKFA